MKHVSLFLEGCYLAKKPLNETERSFLQDKIKMIVNYRLSINSKRQEEIFFPKSVEGSVLETNNRLCWAMGDLPIAFLLLKVSIILQNKELEKLSNVIGLFTLMRKQEEQTLITSSEFRLGTSGIALLYQSFYKITHIEKYQKGADYWRKQTDLFLEKELNNGFYRQNNEQYVELLEALEEYETQINGIWRRERIINFW